MDPVAHVIFARVLVAAFDTPGGSRFGRGAGAAALLGGLSPDADSILMPAGWDIYLRFHEIGTHSLAGAVLIGCGAGAVVHALVRSSRPPVEVGSHTDHRIPPGTGSHTSHLKGLAIAAALGALSHLALDVISGARLGLLWPFLNGRATLPLVAMADPWLIGLLVAGAAVLWLGRQNLPRTALFVLLVVTAFLGVKGVLYMRAREIVRANAQLAGGAPRAFEAKWGSWSIWNVFGKDAGQLRAWRVNQRTGAFDLVLSWPIHAESPDVTRSRSFDTVRNFLSVHELTFAVVEDQPTGHRAVSWSDARFCWQAEPGSAHIDCALWFGGILDANGLPVRQVVRVGAWTQTRSISE